jgi:ABC-2 type transport system permease protein
MKHEFIQAIKKPGYIILTLIIPVLALLTIGIVNIFSTIINSGGNELTRMGYVDRVGTFTEYRDQGLIQLIPYETIENAKAALLLDEIDEFIMIPSDYLSSGSVQRFAMSRELETPMVKRIAIESFLAWNLLDEQVPASTIQLAMNPLDLQVNRLEDDGSIASSQGNIANIIIPSIYGLLLSMALMFGSNSLIAGLGEEKESRLIEVLTSSVSVTQLLIAKVIALGTAGLMQVILWLASAPLILKMASSSIGGFLKSIQIPENFIFLGLIYFILGYLLFSVLSLMVGAITSTAADAHNLSMFYIMAGYIPLWSFGAFINFPDHPIWIALSIFPITAPVQTMLMLGVSDIPFWQLFTSIGTLVLTIMVIQYISIRSFRTFLIMYGKRLRISEIISGFKSL